jgi:hypothetical protein
MLFLQRVTVTKYAPSFWSKKTSFHGIVRNIAKVHLLFEMPEASTVIFKTFKSEWFDLEHVFITSFRILIFAKFKVAPSKLTLNPSSLLLLLRQLFKLFDGFGALIIAH